MGPRLLPGGLGASVRRNHHPMRNIVILIAVVTLLVVAGVLLVTQGPNPTSASATPSPASGVEPAADGAAASGGESSATAASAPAAIKVRPPSVRLSRIPGSYDQPTYVTAPPGDTSRVFIVEKTGTIRIVKGGPLLPRRSSTSGPRVRRWRAGPALDGVPSSLREQRAVLRQLHEPERRHAAWCGTACTADPDSAPRRAKPAHPAVPTSRYANHNGGQLRLRAGRVPLRRHGRRRQRRRPARHAQDSAARSSASCCASTSNVSPVAGRRDLADGPAQPVALLVRPLHGRPVHRRRRSGRLGGDRLPAAAGRGARRQLRLERLRGHAWLYDGGRRPADRAG